MEQTCNGLYLVDVAAVDDVDNFDDTAFKYITDILQPAQSFFVFIYTSIKNRNVCPYCSVYSIWDLDSSEPEMVQLYNLMSPAARSLSHYGS